MYTKLVTKTKAKNPVPGLFYCKTANKEEVKQTLIASSWDIVSESDEVTPIEKGKKWLETAILYPAYGFGEKDSSPEEKDKNPFDKDSEFGKIFESSRKK